MPLFSGIERLIDQFFRCCKVSGLSFTWLQKIYIGKNTLNQFRQDNGYKENKYTKIWNGYEDNVILMEILDQIDIDKVSSANIYEQLQNRYNQIRFN